MTEDRHGVTFPAWREDRSFVSLADVLRVVEPWVPGWASWLVGDCEFSTGSYGSAKLTRLANSHEPLTTAELVALADGVQLVDGDLCCFAGTDDEPFVVVTSVRGDEWDVHSSRADVLRAVKASFPLATSLPLTGPELP